MRLRAAWVRRRTCLLALSLLAPIAASPSVRAGVTALPDKPEAPVVVAPAVHSRLQPRLCRDPRRPELALLDRLPDDAGARPRSLLDYGRALDALQALQELPADDPRWLVLLSFQAEFSVEHQRSLRGQRRELQEARCRAEERGDEPQAARLLTQQLELERRERRWRQHAIELYRRIVSGPQPGTAAPRSALPGLRERALIELACLLALDHRGAEAGAVAAQLLSEYPQSRFVPYAHLVLAESLFDRGTAAR